MQLHQICEDKALIMRHIAKAVRVMAHNRSHQINAAIYGETHYTPDDEDDLFQLGMMAAWQYLSSRDNRGLITGHRSGYILALKSAKSAMTRNGTRDIRITGSLPYAVPTQNTSQTRQPDYDVNQLPAPATDRLELIKRVQDALKKIPSHPKSKQYLLKQLEGYGPTEIGNMFGVSKAAVFFAIQNLTPLVQQALEESISYR